MTEPNSENTETSINSRLGMCEVCNVNPAKYTCPECEVKTCSLPCVKIHKKELECTGIRNKVKFKPIQQFTNMDFQSDYFLLEEATRVTDNVKKVAKTFRNDTFYSVAQNKMKAAAQKRNIHLFFLPKKFSRRKCNSTFYDWKQDKIYWKVEWLFPDAGLKLLTNRFPETQTLAEGLNEHFQPEKCTGPLKKYLMNVGDTSKLVILLKGERETTNKYYLLDKEETLVENLSNRKIIEHPTFFVVHQDKLPEYGNPAPLKTDKYSNNYKGVNLLFEAPRIEEEKELLTHEA